MPAGRGLLRPAPLATIEDLGMGGASSVPASQSK